MSKEHNEELARLVNNFEVALVKAEDYARLHDLNFSISPTYGMGGDFAKVENHYHADITDAEIGEHAWFASSTSC